MKTNPRDALLEKITKVPGLAKSVRRGLRGVADDLRAEGLEHKALKETTKGLVDDIQTVVDTALADLSDNVPEGLSAQITDAILDGLIGISDDEPEEAGADPAAATMPPEDDKMLMMDQGVTHGMTGKQLKMLDTLIETQAGLAQDIGLIAKAVKALEPTATLPASIQDLTSRVKAMEAQLKIRPRSVAQEVISETIVDDKALAEQVKNQQHHLDNFWGSHVKE